MSPALNSSNGSHTATTKISDATNAYLDGVKKQFTLSDEKLLAITRTFVDDFSSGLGQYNKPMAMM